MEYTYSFRPADRTDFAPVWEIIQQAKAQMKQENKQQWNDSYPAPEHIFTDLDNRHAYVLCSGKTIVAYGAVIFDGEPTYQAIRGKWLSDYPYVVIHRLAVANEMKCRGVAVLFMQEVEKLCPEKGIHSFKVDTNSDNFRMQKVLEKCGFTYCGEIIFQGGSRMAYEKLL